MKLLCHLNKIIILLICFLNLTTSTSYSTSLESHLLMMAKMKQKSRAFLETLYISANSVYDKKQEHLDNIERSFLEKNSIEFDSEINSQFESQSESQQEPNHRYDPFFIEHFSEISEDKKQHRNITQYEYREYRNITLTLKKLAKDYPDLVKLSTGQEEFGLPSPGGQCKGEKCMHYIVRLTNHKIPNKNKPQVSNLLVIIYIYLICLDLF